MENFEGFGLHGVLTNSLEHMKYTTPTPIQEQAIPVALKGHDIMGSAQTGTGKTAAFSIPLIEKLLRNPQGTALVLTPTRELGKQIMDVMHQLIGPKGAIKTAFIIGGEPMGKQFAQIKRNPRLIVGTPGRINDHLRRGSLKLDRTDFLVLDETDRMLDMGFSIQLDEIFKFMPQKRQTLMFSATLPKNIVKLADRYLTDPVRIAVGSTIEPAKNIKQDVVRVSDNDKYDELVRQLSKRQGSVIIFVKTKHGTEKLAKRLISADFEAEAIHGDLKQNKRERVIRGFRGQKYRILVATDVVARGLDVPHVEHVINYDLPQVPEDYIHRIGRTARAGAEGSALCMVTPQDGRKWHAIEMLMNPDMAGKAPPKVGKSNRKKGPYKGPRRKFGGGNNNGGGNGGGKKFGGGTPSNNFKGGKKRFNGGKPKKVA